MSAKRQRLKTGFKVQDLAPRVAVDAPDAKKASTTSTVWFITSVYHRPVRRMGRDEEWEYVDDYDAFKGWLNEKVADFYLHHFASLVRPYRPDLMGDVHPTFKFNASIEINKHGWLHHHVAVEATYPRVMNEEKGLLEHLILDYKDLNRVFREQVPLKDAAVPIATKLKVENVQSTSLENILRYIAKRDQ